LLPCFETNNKMQAVLGDTLAGVNQRRTHQGRYMNGRMPTKAFADGVSKPTTQKGEIRAQKQDQNRCQKTRSRSGDRSVITRSVHIGMIQPTEAEERYYTMLNEQKLAA